MITLGPNGIEETPHVLAPAQRQLLHETAGSDVAWCGRGATALYWAFRLAAARRPDVKRPEVIIPSALCLSPANAAILASVRPRFADIDIDTALTNIDHVRERLTGSTVAVLFVHLYGHTACLDDLASLCRERGLLLIEDAAQALGGRLPNGLPVGSVGDVSVYSFNHTKILECGGGALLLRTADVSESFRGVAENTPFDRDRDAITIKLIGESFRNLQHAFTTMLRLRKIDQCADVFALLAAEYAEICIAPLQSPEALAAAWETLPEELDHRMRMARRYRERLAGGSWRLPTAWEHSGVCWRYTLLMDDEELAIEATERLRQAGLLASNHYWPLHSFYDPEDECPIAERFARRCVNLWVDHRVDSEKVDRCADLLGRLRRGV